MSEPALGGSHLSSVPATGNALGALLENLRHGLQTGRRLLLVSIRVSNGSEIAEALGTRAVEQVLLELAQRVEGCGGRLLRSTSLGGLLAALVVDDAVLDDEVDTLESRLRNFIRVQDHDVWPVVTIGLRVCADDEDPMAAVADVRDTLFAAMDRAPGRTRWHDPLVGRQQARQFREVGELARALRQDPAQFALAFQPVVDLETRRILGAEALLRWTHPTFGPLSPLTTVANAERSGLVHELGRLVLRRALGQAASWQAEGRPHLRMHVNVTSSQLREPSFVDDVAELLRDHGVPPTGLLLELTETDLMADELSVRPALSDLRELGVGIGIDDFGTGFSSIARLHQLAVDTVKVDRSLVSGIADTPAAFDLARAVLGLLSTRPVSVVAEGIESAVQAAHLRALGCRLGQGFHLGRPVPADLFPTSPEMTRADPVGSEPDRPGTVRPEPVPSPMTGPRPVRLEP